VRNVRLWPVGDVARPEAALRYYPKRSFYESGITAAATWRRSSRSPPCCWPRSFLGRTC